MRSVNVKFSDGADTYNCEGLILGNFIILISKEDLLVCVYDTETNQIKWMDLEADYDSGHFEGASDLERMNFSKIYHYIVSHIKENSDD
mgnify:CR=1 FL=1